MINDDWWTGQIEQLKSDCPSAFQSLKVRWDNGEIEWMSPWDLEPLDITREYLFHCAPRAALPFQPLLPKFRCGLSLFFDKQWSVSL